MAPLGWIASGKSRALRPPHLEALMQVRKEIQVSGIVQGVGFRPYVFRLATDRNLGGNISNTSAGVTIEIQGPPELVEDFVSRLPQEAPALAQITHVAVRETSVPADRGFEIVQPCRRARERADLSGRRDLRRLSSGVVRPSRSQVSLSFYQLHELRTAFHDRAGRPLRPAAHLDVGLPDVRAMPRGI